jgi:hypothetical protein
MNRAHADLRQQLQAPDPAGRDLSLLRTRLYRFSSDPRWYVLAESLEENYISGKHPKPATITAVRACLDNIRHDGRPLEFHHDLAAAEDISIGTDLAQRRPYTWHHAVNADPPARVVVILGAPRSGTSHLFNLLAATGKFAYFTTASCWAWPVRNLHQPGRQLYTALADTVLAVDNKRTRIIPCLVMPGEAEDIWDRAMPVYHHIRDQHQTASSMRRNHFSFVMRNRPLDGESAWSLFVDAVRNHAPPDRLLTVRHEELLHDPRRLIRALLAIL